MRKSTSLKAVNLLGWKYLWYYDEDNNPVYAPFDKGSVLILDNGKYRIVKYVEDVDDVDVIDITDVPLDGIIKLPT